MGAAMTFPEFDSLYLAARWHEEEPSSGFRTVAVSPATFAELRGEWSWTGTVPKPLVCSTLVGDDQIGIIR